MFSQNCRERHFHLWIELQDGDFGHFREGETERALLGLMVWVPLTLVKAPIYPLQALRALLSQWKCAQFLTLFARQLWRLKFARNFWRLLRAISNAFTAVGGGGLRERSLVTWHQPLKREIGGVIAAILCHRKSSVSENFEANVFRAAVCSLVDFSVVIFFLLYPVSKHTAKKGLFWQILLCLVQISSPCLWNTGRGHF